MGHISSRLSRNSYSEKIAHILGTSSRKRKQSDEDNDASLTTQNDVSTPKKKKLLTTTEYIYKALFKEQNNSDITVMALGKIWKLHKIYLSQSPYFSSMFGGSWRESCEDYIHITIVDNRITVESLDAILGSLYSDEIDIVPNDVISILATATHFQMDKVIEKCAEVMLETMNIETVVPYYEASSQYGTLNVKKRAFEWLEINLLSSFQKHRKELGQMSEELVAALVASPDLYVLQTECSLYSLLRTWLYLRLHRDYDLENSLAASETNTEAESDPIKLFFTKRSDKVPFLLTAEGYPYLNIFQALRTQYITTHFSDLKIMLQDNIVPQEWLQIHVFDHWKAVLKIDHFPELGPANLDEMSFLKNCMRCGRTLMEPGYQKWRWTGFNFGLDLILIFDNSRSLILRRHHRNDPERLLSMKCKRQFMIRASVTSVDNQRQPIYTQKSKIMSLSLEKNEEATLLKLDPQLVHPLIISINFLVVHPTSQTFKDSAIMAQSEANATMPISEIGGTYDRSNTPTNVASLDEQRSSSTESNVSRTSSGTSTSSWQ